MEYSVPVVLVTVEGYTVAVLFCETDLYEVDVDTELVLEVELKEVKLVTLQVNLMSMITSEHD